MPSPTLGAFASEMTELVSRAAAAVVQVQIPGRRPTTGTIVKTDQVLLVGHTVAPAERVRIAVSDRLVDAEIGGRDGASDLALIKATGLSVEPLAARSDSVRVGEPVAIVGRDRWGGTAAAFGIVGGLTGPVRLAGGSVEQIMRIDATPFRGISGAAVVDTNGKLVGIANGALQRGAAYGIPIPVALRIAASLAEHGRIKRGYLGVGARPVSLREPQRGGRTQSEGLLVVEVAEGGPAEKGGLVIGDVLLSFDGHPLRAPDDLVDLLTAELVNRPAPLVILRGGQPETIEVTAGERGAR
jgi:S1-C subfamily serine protease